MTALFIFLSLSSINHAYSGFREDNKSHKNLMNQIMTTLLLALVVPLMTKRTHHRLRVS